MCRNGHSLLLHSPATHTKRELSGHRANTVRAHGQTRDQQTKFGVEVALGHLGHVVFMEELALVSLFAQSSEPVLTHHRLLPADVAKRTHGTCECKQNTRDRLRQVSDSAGCWTECMRMLPPVWNLQIALVLEGGRDEAQTLWLQ